VNQSFDMPAVERLSVGAVGPPGQRVFYLQARQDRTLVTLKVEKAHVAELSARLLDLLADLPDDASANAEAAGLEAPIEPDFVVGTLSLAYDEENERFLLLAEELVDEGEDASIARMGATPAQIAGLAHAGRELVEAGRPPCTICGHPLDPRGHVCPRSNGHGPPTP
jgi:uncharacterized repeat protein (TIGR03847 family)